VVFLWSARASTGCLFRCKKKVEIRKPAWSCCHPSSLYTYNVNNVSYNKFGGMIIKKRAVLVVCIFLLSIEAMALQGDNPQGKGADLLPREDQGNLGAIHLSNDSSTLVNINRDIDQREGPDANNGRSPMADCDECLSCGSNAQNKSIGWHIIPCAAGYYGSCSGYPVCRSDFHCPVCFYDTVYSWHACCRSGWWSWNPWYGKYLNCYA